MTLKKVFLFGSLLLLHCPLAAFDNIQLKATITAPTTAQGFNPSGVAVDRAGRIWVTDESNQALVLFSSMGVLIQQLGGPGAGAGQFLQPHGVAIDLDGQIYVADTGNDRVQVFGPDGKWRLSFGQRGTAPGEFRGPWAISASQDGVVVVADRETQRLQFFSKNGIFLHAIETGSPMQGAAFDATGRVYTANTKLHQIEEWSTAGQLLKSFTGAEPGVKPFSKPESVAVSNTGLLYVADRETGQIREIDPKGHTSGIFGRAGSGEGQFKTVAAMATTGSSLYVADLGNHRLSVFDVSRQTPLPPVTPVPAVRVQVALKNLWPVNADSLALGSDGHLIALTQATGLVTTYDRDGKVFSQFDGKERLALKSATGVATDPTGNLFLADAGGNRVVKADATGHLLAEFGVKNSLFKGGQGELAHPAGLAYANQSIFVADTGNSRFQVYNDQGIYMFAGGEKGNDPGQLKSPTGIAADNDRIYVTDTANHKVVAFNGTGRFLREMGLVGGEALLEPRQVLVDREGNLYVLDTGRNRVVIYDDQGVFVAGFGGFGKAKGFLNHPKAAALSDDGRLYLAEDGRVQVFRVVLLPPAPTALAAKPGEGFVELKWQPAKTRFPVKYIVFRSPPDGEPTRVKETVETTLSDDTLLPNTTYTYTVVSQSIQGANSVPSAPVVASAPPSSNGPRVEIVSTQIDDIFSAHYKYYNHTSVGSVLIRNNSPQPFDKIKISFAIQGYMDFPTETEISGLHPHEQKDVPLLATFNNRILEVSETTPIQAQVKLTYYQGSQEMTVVENLPFKLYSRNTIRWDKKERLAAFVTPNDPPVVDFARGVVVPFTEAHAGAPVNPSMVTAWALFEGLSTYGISYVARPTNPYDRVSLDSSTIDTMQFARETLTRKSGDCADVVALMASLLESMSVPTCALDAPGHIFFMFDTGELDLNALGFPESMIVLYSGTYWIPVEGTALGSPFLEAWKQGAEQYRRWSAQGKLSVLDLHQAWKTFEPATLPETAARAEIPERVAIEQKYLKDWQALVALRWQTSQAAAKLALTKNPNAGQPNLDLGFLAVDFKRYPEAHDYFMKARDDSSTAAAAYNNLGNLALLQNDLPRAESNYKSALQKDPNDAGIEINLARLYMKEKLADKASAAFDAAVKLDPSLKDKYGDVSALAP